MGLEIFFFNKTAEVFWVFFLIPLFVKPKYLAALYPTFPKVTVGQSEDVATSSCHALIRQNPHQPLCSSSMECQLLFIMLFTPGLLHSFTLPAGSVIF